jgi:4-amino-4-deoxy-L-arabinose transferase-like glycosyltransferase
LLALSEAATSSTDAARVTPKRVTMPQPPAHKLRMWVMLLVALGACVPPMLIELGQADATRRWELDVLAAARETWTPNEQGERADWLVPTVNGEPVYDTPPLAVWLTMLSWSALDAETATADQLVYRARLLAVTMALAALAATYWAGYSVGGVRTAWMAALATGTGLLLLREARTASYNIHLMAWVTLAVAAALWAMRPTRPISWLGRRVTGWLIAGLALGGAIMTIGAPAIPYVVVPLICAIVVTRSRRLGNVTGLVFALILGVLLGVPWYLRVAEGRPDSLAVFLTHYGPRSGEPEAFYYYLLLFGVVFPWTVYLVGALAQPFVPSARHDRRRLLIAWLWFVVLVVLMSAVRRKEDNYVLALLVPLGVLVAQQWDFHARLADEGLPVPGLNLLRVPHWLLIVFGSVGYALFIALQGRLVAGGHLAREELPDLALPVVVGLGLMLLALAIIGAVRHWHARPEAAYWATALWMVLATTVGYYSYSRSYHSTSEIRAHAESLAQTVRGESIKYLYEEFETADGAVKPFYKPSKAMLFYSGRVIRPWPVDQMADSALQPTFALVRADRQTGHRRLVELGYAYVNTYTDRHEIALYRRLPPQGGGER